MTVAAEPRAGPSARALATPFFYSAPIAVACAGVVLLIHGERALIDSWSPITMGLTHFATLGFVSMTGIGAFYRIAPEQLGQPIPTRVPARVALLGFAIGILSLCVGLTSGAAVPVFIAIGALFPALAAFFWPAIRLLHAAGAGHPFAAPWRLAIGAFFTVAVLGIWVAHGHGGMAFPGPRSLWIQLHLSIALFGWVGVIATAALRARLVDRGVDVPPLQPSWAAWGWTGVGLCALVLAIDYAGGLEVEPATARMIGLVAAAPVVFATVGLGTAWAFAALRSSATIELERDEATLWRLAFGFGPATVLGVVLAMAADDAISRVLFGWLAIWGWAGLVAHAALYGLAPPRLPARFTLGLHGLSLALGMLATALQSPSLAVATGIALIVFAVALLPRSAT